MYDFSLILESVCVLPQLLLLRQTTVPTVIDSGYILTLGSYRALYILNWILRETDVNDRKPNVVSVIFGIVQTALYVDFAWVYYTRQRVKLRNGGVVDADDLRHGWLLSKIFGHKRFHDAEADDEESAPALGGGGGRVGGGPADSSSSSVAGSGPRRSKWGARGISISADDGVHQHEAARGRGDDDDGFNGAVDPDAKMKDPDELARALDDDDDDDVGPSTSAHAANDRANEVSNGSEWRDT